MLPLAHKALTPHTQLNKYIQHVHMPYAHDIAHEAWTADF